MGRKKRIPAVGVPHLKEKEKKKKTIPNLALEHLQSKPNQKFFPLPPAWIIQTRAYSVLHCLICCNPKNKIKL